MSAQPHVEDSFTFVGGLYTEGGYFVTPKNSWKEGQNVIPTKDGSIGRRPPIIYEEGYEVIAEPLTTSAKNIAYTIEMWESVGGDGNNDWFVVQIGHNVYFYEAYPGTVSARPITCDVNGSGQIEGQGIDLSYFTCYGNVGLVYDKVISVASVYGNLIITHEDCEPILVTWQPTNVLTAQKLKLYIRDFKGLPSPVVDTAEKTETEWEALSFYPHALYNVYNQGWYDSQVEAYKTANSNLLPANTKQWVYGKDNNGDFDTTVLSKVDFGSSPAPKGRFILEAFYEDRATALAQVPQANTVVPITPIPGSPGYYDPNPGPGGVDGGGPPGGGDGGAGPGGGDGE